MSIVESMSGRCLCGAVSFVATGVHLDHHACHCDMCRRWGGAPFFGIHCEGVTFDGEDSICRYDSFERRKYPASSCCQRGHNRNRKQAECLFQQALGPAS